MYPVVELYIKECTTLYLSSLPHQWETWHFQWPFRKHSELSTTGTYVRCVYVCACVCTCLQHI